MKQTLHLLTNLNGRIRLPRRDSQDRDARISQRRIHKAVPYSTLEALVRPVIQLDHRNHAQARRITKNKINVFACDAIKCRLPTAPARVPNGPNNVCKSDLGENLVFRPHRLLKNTEE